VEYSERVVAPVWWWLVALLGAGVLWPVLGVAIGWWWGLAAAAAVFVVIAAVLLAGSTKIIVDGTGLRVGRAWIEHRYIAGCRPLDAEQTRARRGREADARAYLALRSYLPTAVEVELDDPADPVPYWLISSRHPERLADALITASAERGPRR
jgi:hypothetical protein